MDTLPTLWFIPYVLLKRQILILIEYYVQAGAKVNVSAGGATPLHIAADNGSPELINCLLKAGADPNVSDEVRHLRNTYLLAHPIILLRI